MALARRRARGRAVRAHLDVAAPKRHHRLTSGGVDAAEIASITRRATYPPEATATAITCQCRCAKAHAASQPLQQGARCSSGSGLSSALHEPLLQPALLSRFRGALLSRFRGALQ